MADCGGEDGRVLDRINSLLGLDRSSQLLVIDRNLDEIKKASVSGLPVVQADCEYLPLRPASVHVALGLSLLEHLKNPRLFLERATAALVDDGILVLQVSNMTGLVEVHAGFVMPHIVPPFVKDVFGRRWERKAGLYLNWSVTKEFIQSTVEGCGLSCKTFAFSFSPDVLVGAIKSVYSLVGQVGLLRAFPLDYLFIGRKERPVCRAGVA